MATRSNVPSIPGTIKAAPGGSRAILKGGSTVQAGAPRNMWPGSRASVLPAGPTTINSRPLRQS